MKQAEEKEGRGRKEMEERGDGDGQETCVGADRMGGMVPDGW